MLNSVYGKPLRPLLLNTTNRPNLRMSVNVGQSLKPSPQFSLRSTWEDNPAWSNTRFRITGFLRQSSKTIVMTSRSFDSKNFLISIRVSNKFVEPPQKQDAWQRRTSASPHPGTKEEEGTKDIQRPCVYLHNLFSLFERAQKVLYWTRSPVLNFPFCQWSIRFLDLQAPSSL